VRRLAVGFDPLRFLTELADRARTHGAEIRTNTELMDVIIEGDRCVGARLATGERIDADHVVLASGIWTTQMARRIGIDVPMQAGKDYHRNITPPDPSLKVASVLVEKHVADLFIATGHARMGLTLGPITGRLVSECILDGEPSLDLTPLRVDRVDRFGRGGRMGPVAATADPKSEPAVTA
jgi:glycine/D-amino acid oxidase-like deaminating enzyme